MFEPENIVTIWEPAFFSPEELHETLAQLLDFPEHYGANLDALNDCLGDISTPTLISVVRARSTDDDNPLPLAAYLDKICVSLMRAARNNPAIDVEIVFDADDGDKGELFEGAL